MTDTTYEFETKLESLIDPSEEPAFDLRTVELTVIATMESMTRYIGLEIRALIEEIERANAEGIKTGGLLPISMYPALRMNDRALGLILGGDLGRAARVHRSNIKIVEAFLHALDGFNGKGNKIPAHLDADWRARAEAILDDQAVAATSLIPSA